MTTQWGPQVQQPQQYQQYQHPQQFQPPHHYQQLQHQPGQRYPQNGYGPHVPPQQYPPGSHQFSQFQKHEPQGHVNQVGQFPQAGQYAQTQTHQQPQQQYPQAQQQGYSNYQQQYQTTQYHPQHQSTLQHGQYQQSHPQQNVPSYGPSPLPATAISCFNCGTPNHIAQNCPEPKRSVPAGALDPKRYANPLKRARSDAHGEATATPINQAGQTPGYPAGYTQEGYGHNNYAHYQGSYTTATQSNQSQAHQQAWQQYWQWQAHQQSQHQQQQQQGNPHHQSLYQLPADQAAQYPGSGEPIQASAQNLQYSTSQTYQHRGVSAHVTESATNSTELPQHDPQYSAWVGESASVHLPQQADSQFTTQNPLPSEQYETNSTEDSDDVDLDLLDVPDMPKVLALDGGGSQLPNMLISPPASLISMPLPANFVVADALYPIPPPGPETQGHCQSKYLRDTISEKLYENINLSKYWKDHCEDTAFLDRPDDDKVVPVDHVRGQLRERYINGEVTDDLNRHTRSQSRSVSVRKDSADVYSSLEKLERGIAEIKAKQAALMKKRALARGEQLSSPRLMGAASPNEFQTTIKEEHASPPQLSPSDRCIKREQDTEDVLAALGVTGTPKPVTPGNVPFYGSMHDSYSKPSADTMRQYQERRSSGSAPDTPGFKPFPPPPPPPLKFEAASSNEVTNGTTAHDGPNHRSGHVNGMEQISGLHNIVSDEEILGLIEPQYENPRSRKRSHNRRYSSSDEDDTPARRQEDDVTPKFKRRQPMVAAAYSRRW